MRIDGSKVTKLALRDKIDLFEYVSKQSSMVKLFKSISFIFCLAFIIINTILFMNNRLTGTTIIIVDFFVIFLMIFITILNIKKQREYKYIKDCCLEDENFFNYYQNNIKPK